MISPNTTPAHAGASAKTAAAKTANGSVFASLVADAHDKSPAPQTPAPAPSGKSAKADGADHKSDAARADDKRNAARDDQTDAQAHQADASKSHAAKPAKDDKAEAGKDDAQKDDQGDADAAQTVLIQAAPPPPAPIPNIVTPPAGDTAQDSDGDAALAELSQPGKAGTAPQPTKTASASAPDAAANDNDGADSDDAATAPAVAKPAAPVTAKTNDKAAANDDAKPDVRHDGDPAPAPQAAAQPAPQPQQPHPALAAAQPVQPNAVSQTPGHVATSVEVAAQPQHTPNLNSLAVEISAKSQNGAKQFEIRLDPPELGRVDVRLSIDATGKASAHLTADQPQTLDLLQKDSTSLTRALRDAGLDVAQNGLNFSLRGGNQGGSQGGGQDGARSRGAITLQATKTIEAAGSSAVYRSSAGDARLDIHV